MLDFAREQENNFHGSRGLRANGQPDQLVFSRGLQRGGCSKFNRFSGAPAMRRKKKKQNAPETGQGISGYTINKPALEINCFPKNKPHTSGHIDNSDVATFKAQWVASAVIRRAMCDYVFKTDNATRNTMISADLFINRYKRRDVMSLQWWLDFVSEDAPGVAEATYKVCRRAREGCPKALRQIQLYTLSCATKDPSEYVLRFDGDV